MTGFGKSIVENQQLKLNLEIKTVNHRYLDFIIRVPKKFSAYEELIKKQLKGHLERGRVEVYLSIEEATASDFSVKPNYAVLDEYKSAFEEIQARYQLTDKVTLNLLTRYPEALIIEAKVMDEEETLALLNTCVEEAVVALLKMREMEGQALYQDILNRSMSVSNLLNQIEALSPQILESHKNKMSERIKELLADKGNFDENRIMLEVAIFADRTNITEEIVRLRSHLEQLRAIFKDKDSKGRKLDFLLQEMNREVNTIGSKSPDVDISNFVVELKSEMEKIREQIQNIE
jgi:uncharacterized protein (TIGR00255 family)